MRKYGLIISFIIALVFVGCTITLVKRQKKETETEIKFCPAKKDAAKKFKLVGDEVSK